jgi:hypothetical protein
LLHQRGDSELEAKRHVLEALEEAPRFREAQHLLLELEKEKPAPSQTNVERRSAERRAAGFADVSRGAMLRAPIYSVASQNISQEVVP